MKNNIVHHILCACLVFFVSSALFLDDSVKNWRAVLAQKKIVLQTLKTEQQMALRNKKTDNNIERLKRAHTALYQALSASPPQTFTLSFQQSGLTPMRINTRPSENNIVMQVTGHYAQLLHFLSLMDEHPWPFTLKTLEISDQNHFKMVWERFDASLHAH